MILKVLRFSQEASLEDPKDMRNFLVVGNDEIEVRVGVSSEDIQKIIQVAFGLSQKTANSVEDTSNEDELVDAREDQATVYGEEVPHNQFSSAVDEDGIESL